MADPPNEKRNEKPNEKPNGQPKEEKDSLPATTFWEFLASLGDRWPTEGLSLYVYRLWPITDTRNPERFLCKLQEPIDEDYLLRNFGSGKYWLVLNNGNGKNLRKYTANPHNPDFPPRVAPQEVIESNPQNKLYFEVWARKEGHPAAKQRADQNGGEIGNGTDSAVKELASLVKLAFGDKRTAEADSLTKSLVNWALAQKDKERADNSPKEVANLVRELKDLLPAQTPAAADPLAIVEKVLSIQNKGSAQSRTESDIEKLWNLVERAQGRGEREPMEAMKDTIELFAQVKDLFKPETPPVAAAAASPDDSAWERVLINLAGQAGPLAAAVPAIIAAFKGTPPPVVPNPAPGATGPVLTAFDPYRNQAAMRAYAEAQKFAAGATPPQPSAAPPAGPAPPQPATATGQAPDDGLAQVPGLIVTALNCMNRGIDGHACAESIITLNGELTYESLAGQIKAVGVPVAIQLAKNIPEVAAQVTTFETPLARFITQFIEGPQWDDEETESKGAAA